MKILIVSNMYPDKKNPSTGTFVKNFCEQLELLGIKYGKSFLKKKDTKILKVVAYCSFYLKSFYKCVFQKYSLVYIHYPSFSSVPVLLARKIRKFEIYVNVHGSDVIPQKYFQKKMHRFTVAAINSSSKVIVPSQYFKSIIINKYGVRKEKVFVYPSGGVDLEKFKMYDQRKVMNLKEQYNISLDMNVIGFVSRMTISKGWRIYLEAIKKIIDDGYSCVFFMIGSGDDDDKVIKEIERLRLKEYIIRLPQQSQEKLVNFYNLFDIFVFPTMATESLGLVAIEAMACGCIVVGSDYAAPGDFIKNGYNGKTFIKGNSNALAMCIENYFDNKKDHEYMKENSLRTAFEYSKENAIITLSKIMCNALENEVENYVN